MFQGSGAIPDQWKDISKEEAIKSLDEMFLMSQRNCKSAENDDTCFQLITRESSCDSLICLSEKN